MRKFYPAKCVLVIFLLISFVANSQTPTQVGPGVCDGVIANFNTSDNGFNSPSVYGSIFDSSLYYHAGRGYWTDYLPPYRTGAPGFPRVMNIISPPYVNANPVGTFNVGFSYIVGNPAVDRFQIRIIAVTLTSQGTVTNVVATSGVQHFSNWSTPAAYVDGTTTGPVPDQTALLNGFQGNICVRLIDPDIENDATTSYRVEVSYLINEAAFAVFDNLSVGPQNSPLPVNFIGLVAQRDNKNVDLKWDVSEEINVREYQVETSTTGSGFITVGTAAAKGKSIYTFTNYNAPSDVVYYRIKSVDIDGHVKFSGIIRLNGNNSYSTGLTVYPMPATNEITVQHKKLNAGAKLVITSAEGRVIKIISPAQGASHTPIDISALTKGIYFIRLDDGTGDVQSTKLIKN